MPSFTNGEALGAPKRRSVFVSLPVKSSGGPPAHQSHIRPSSGCSSATTAPPAASGAARSDGRAASCPHAHVFRNQTVGSRWIGAGPGPRLVAVTRIRMSSGAAFAYSTVTSK